MIVLIERNYKKGRKYFVDELEHVVSIECSVCLDIKPMDSFQNMSRDTRTGKRPFCKSCDQIRKKKDYESNKQSLRYYHERKDDTGYKAKRAEWRKNNRGRLHEYNKKWHEENRVKVSKRKRVYCSQEDVIKHRSEYMSYYKDTPEGRASMRRSVKNRRVARMNAPMTIAYQEALADFKDTFGNVCAFTGFELVESSIEHLLPISFGGGNTNYNLIPVELIINCWKTNKNVFEWIDFMEEELDFTFFFENTIPYLASKMDVSIEEYVDWYNNSYQEKKDRHHEQLAGV